VKETDLVSPFYPSDRELLRAAYRHLDLRGLLADCPALDQAAVKDLFRRLAAQLPPATTTDDAAHFILHTDGGSRGNPGPAGYGVVLADAAGKVIEEAAEFIGRATSNEAEYHGLLHGLRLAVAHGAVDLLIRADSELVVCQINGRYQVKSPKLRPLFEEARALLRGIPQWRMEHISREHNHRADMLANRAMDQA
jgi:ribonuclease HI